MRERGTFLFEFPVMDTNGIRSHALAVLAHLCSHRKQHSKQCHIYKQWTMWNMSWPDSRLFLVVANGVRVPRSLGMDSLWVWFPQETLCSCNTRQLP